MDQSRLHRYQREAARGKARLLKERLRTRTVSREALELASYLGDLAAQEALGSEASPPPTDLRRWVLGLDRWGWEALTRVSFAALRFLLPLWENRYPSDSRPREALDAAEAWLGNPNQENAQLASRAARQAERAATAAQQALDSPSADYDYREDAAAAVADAVSVVCDVTAGEPANYISYATHVATVLSSWSDSVGGDMHEAICKTVVPWALRRKTRG